LAVFLALAERFFLLVTMVLTSLIKCRLLTQNLFYRFFVFGSYNCSSNQPKYSYSPYPILL
jgi:hypothetical protein